MPTHRGPRSEPRHVFINVPFDERYEPLLLALVLALLARGLVPRSVLEVPPNRDRLRRLTDLIAQCGFSLHDLSRVTLSKRPYRVPRFNMPFEAGLAVAISRYIPSHQWRLLEERPYRLQQSLGDLNGFDPAIHHGRMSGIFDAIDDLFPTLPVPEHLDLQNLWRQLAGYRRRFIRRDLYTPGAFAKLVRAAALLAGRPAV